MTAFPATEAQRLALGNGRNGAGPAGNIDRNEGRLDAARAAFGKITALRANGQHSARFRDSDAWR